MMRAIVKYSRRVLAKVIQKFFYLQAEEFLTANRNISPYREKTF